LRTAIIPAEQQSVTEWSGGRTREIYISGRSASYAQRDFLLRLSSATCEDEASTFTMLPAYERALLVLEGNISLMHDGKEPIQLDPYGGVDYFSGGSLTLSRGTCRDFNVMWAKDASFTVKVEVLKTFPCIVTCTGEEFFYAPEKAFSVAVAAERRILPPKGLRSLPPRGRWQPQADG
jgi:environmental stress-induced protein Ves